jgi:hypothetical protein
MRPVNSNWIGLLLFGTPLCGWGFWLVLPVFFDPAVIRSYGIAACCCFRAALASDQDPPAAVPDLSALRWTPKPMRPVNSNWVGLLLFGTPLCGWGFWLELPVFSIQLFFDVTGLQPVSSNWVGLLLFGTPLCGWGFWLVLFFFRCWFF